MFTRAKYLYAIIIPLLLLKGYNVQAQQASAKGDRYFDQNQFGEAIEFYKKDSRSRNKKVKEHATQRLADCYRITGNFAQAEVVYKKILGRNKKSPLAYLNYGISLMNGARYQEAGVMFKEYLVLVPGDKMGTVYLQSCDSAQKWLDETLGREVRNIHEINTEESEMGPVVLSGDLVYLSARKGSKSKLVSFDGSSEIRRLDFYTVPVINITSNKKVMPMTDLNTVAHEGPACYSPDGREMYFTQTVKGTKNDYTNQVVNVLQVFFRSKDKNGIWSEPRSAFEFNSQQFSVAHPALTPDGRRIYFMSDMPGGYGKTDIYFSQKLNDGNWGKPQNAGPGVNTFAFEMFPSFYDDGDFYFSSNGHPGMGQLDIFRCTIENGLPVRPTNMRPPVNSISNDFGICFYGGSARGFFSSDRFNGKGGEDLYAFAEIRPIEMVVAEETIILNDYSMFDNITYEIRDSTGLTEPVFNKVSGKLIVTIKENGTYIVEASQYGQLINRMSLRYTKDLKEKSVSYQVLTTDKTIRLSGYCFLGLHPKYAKIKRDPKRTYSKVRNRQFTELEMNIDDKGVYKFRVDLEPGKRNEINSMDVIGFEK